MYHVHMVWHTVVTQGGQQIVLSLRYSLEREACPIKTEIDLKLSSEQQFPFLVSPRDPRASQLLDEYLPG